MEIHSLEALWGRKCWKKGLLTTVEATREAASISASPAPSLPPVLPWSGSFFYPRGLPLAGLMPRRKYLAVSLRLSLGKELIFFPQTALT